MYRPYWVLLLCIRVTYIVWVFYYTGTFYGPRDLKVVDLARNKLRHLARGSLHLKGYRDRHIYLNSNHISSVDVDAFIGSRMLQFFLRPVLMNVDSLHTALHTMCGECLWCLSGCLSLWIGGQFRSPNLLSGDKPNLTLCRRFVWWFYVGQDIWQHCLLTKLKQILLNCIETLLHICFFIIEPMK